MLYIFYTVYLFRYLTLKKNSDYLRGKHDKTL